MDPNNPEIANAAGKRPLVSNSPSPTRSTEANMDDEPNDHYAGSRLMPPIESRDRSSSDAGPSRYGRPDSLTTSPGYDASIERLHPRSAALRSSTTWDTDRRKSDSYSVRKSSSWGHEFRHPFVNSGDRFGSPSSIATSPSLGPHMISPRNTSGQPLLPAIVAAGSDSEPQRGQDLPSVQDLLSYADRSNERANNRARAASYSIPSTISNFVPRKLSATFPVRNSNRYPPNGIGSVSEHSRQSSISGTSINSRSSPGAVSARYGSVSEVSSNPAGDFGASQPARSRTGSSITSNAGGSTTTSTEGMDMTRLPTPTARRNSQEPAFPNPQPGSTMTLALYPAAQNHVNGFKCTFDGCEAPAFATQYLLNSHANVHSQDRPYFCPVPGCSRGPGGKGFKRKNEMNRHGLVHESPGYMCPFCPGHKHHYPRPDNLQRHVRMHHKEIRPDDDQLRAVLDHRPRGGVSKGRRRRT